MAASSSAQVAADARPAGVASAVLSGAQAVGGFINDQRKAGAIDTSAKFNTELADLQAQDAIIRGGAAARKQELLTSGEVGRARAAMAAGGVQLSSGSALDVQAQDAAIGAFDAQMIRNNAAREALGITTKQALDNLGSRAEAEAYRNQSIETLATGAARTYGMFKKLSGRGRGGGQSGAGGMSVPSGDDVDDGE